MTRIVLVDDHQVLRDGIRRSLEDAGEEVVGEGLGVAEGVGEGEFVEEGKGFGAGFGGHLLLTIVGFWGLLRRGAKRSGSSQ